MLTLAELRGKYARMLDLRLAQASADGGDLRPALAALAAEFPGALRELDALSHSEIEGRVAALDRAIADGAHEQPWMTVLRGFHSLARGALCAKRWLGGRRDVSAAHLAAFGREVDQLPYPAEALLWKDALPQLARPPGGKVTSLVVARLAPLLALTEDETRALTFRASRQARRPGDR